MRRSRQLVFGFSIGMMIFLMAQTVWAKSMINTTWLGVYFTVVPGKLETAAL